MSFFCPHFDVEKEFCLMLQVECVAGRPGCVLRNNSVFYVPAEERLKEMESLHRRPTPRADADDAPQKPS